MKCDDLTLYVKTTNVLISERMLKYNICDPKKREDDMIYSMEEILQFSTCYQKEKTSDKKNISLLSLLKGSTIFMKTSNNSNNNDKKRNEERRQFLLRKQEEKSYQAMTRGITNKARDKDEQAEMKSMKLQLSIGVNCMVARITAFVALYMVAGSVTTNETTVKFLLISCI